jgi:hypothetical protein
MDEVHGFSTPEEAALEDFPPGYARVALVTYSRDGETAVVDLLTNEEPTLYPYYVHCSRDADGRWHEEHSHN